MKKYLTKTIIFILIQILFFLLLFFLPATPKESKYLIFAEKYKDDLLLNTQSPRIILMGGSNVSFGINSQMIKEAFNMNVVNTATIGSYGLKYILDHNLQFIKKDDIVIVMPEYHLFYREYNYANEHLIRNFVDVNKKNLKLLGYKQFLNLLKYIPYVTYYKLKISDYYTEYDPLIYNINSFNQYGDHYTHWNRERSAFLELSAPDLYYAEVMENLKKFEENAGQRGAVVYIAYPPLHSSVFDASIEAIEKIKEEYEKYGFTVLGNPYEYRFDDSLIFDNSYHSTGEGAVLRTRLLIDDLKNYLDSL